MEIRLYLRMLQKGWWIIVLTILIAINTALLSAYFTKPTYQTSARFSVSPNTSISYTGQDVLNSLQALDKRSIVQTYAEFLNSRKIFEDTVKNMNLNPADMEDYKHSTVVVPDANVLELTFTGPDPKLLALLTNNTGQTAIQAIKEVYKVYDINFLDPALVPAIPINPQPLRDAGVAAILGVVIGSALAIMSEQIRVPIDSYRQRASTDTVSMVLNRRYLQNRLDELVSRCGPSDSLSIGLVRLNGLRDMIDTLPQPVVQQLLREVAVILKKELRGNDLIGRWNDTTFALVLPSTPESAAERTMERIQVALLKPIVLSNYGETFQVDPTVSVSACKQGDTTANLTERAEHALGAIHFQEADAVLASGK